MSDDRPQEDEAPQTMMEQAAIFAKHLPGFGAPSSLPIDEFDAALSWLADDFAREASATDTRAWVEHEGRRTKR